MQIEYSIYGLPLFAFMREPPGLTGVPLAQVKKVNIRQEQEHASPLRPPLTSAMSHACSSLPSLNSYGPWCVALVSMDYSRSSSPYRARRRWRYSSSSPARSPRPSRYRYRSPTPRRYRYRPPREFPRQAWPSQRYSPHHPRGNIPRSHARPPSQSYVQHRSRSNSGYAHEERDNREQSPLYHVQFEDGSTRVFKKVTRFPGPNLDHRMTYGCRQLSSRDDPNTDRRPVPIKQEIPPSEHFGDNIASDQRPNLEEAHRVVSPVKQKN
jgi:hypothetical protein